MAKVKEQQIKLEEEYNKVESSQNIWKPQINDVIEGKILKRQKSNFGNSFVLEVKGEPYLLPNHTVLEDLLTRCYIGDLVKVQCVGKTEGKQGKNGTMLYMVWVKKAV
jgi:hypothetical protein